MDRSNLAIRMKEFYENVPKTKLMRRTPVAIRIDGKAFHTFTKGFQKPFDKVLMKSMQETTKYLCENIQGCVFGYTQSDEITLILIDYQTFDTCAWFDYEVQKLCSIAASMATMAFNRYFKENVKEYASHIPYYGTMYPCDEKEQKYMNILNKAVDKGAMFDARVFNIPKEEVTNLIYWRQLDATRNSIQMVGQANFSHKELQNKSCNDIQDMLFKEKNINWNDFPIDCKRGSAVIYSEYQNPNSSNIKGKGWIIDTEMPILRGKDREYVDKLIYIGEQ